MSAWGIRSRLPVAVSAALVLSLALAGCTVDDQPAASETRATVRGDEPQRPDKSVEKPATSVATISGNVRARAKAVAVDTPVTIAVSDGTLDSVVFRPSDGKRLGGSFEDGRTR